MRRMMMIIRKMLIHLIIGWLRCQEASDNSGRRRFEAVSIKKCRRSEWGMQPLLPPIKDIRGNQRNLYEEIWKLSSRKYLKFNANQVYFRKYSSYMKKHMRKYKTSQSENIQSVTKKSPLRAQARDTSPANPGCYLKGRFEGTWCPSSVTIFFNQSI